MIKQCVQCSEPLLTHIQSIQLYYCDSVDCPNYGLYQTGINEPDDSHEIDLSFLKGRQSFQNDDTLRRAGKNAWKAFEEENLPF
jgi:hypothetical protein